MQPIKRILKKVARQTVGRLPPAPSRLTGTLARDGGRPVRDVRLRPWASVDDGNFSRWHTEMRGVFRRIFLGGIEGLPQPLAEQFAQQWATYCGCRYGLLLTNGTDALRIGLAAVLDHDGLDYGGEVIVPNFSFIASATAPLDRRFGVAFVDVDPGTLLLDPKRVEEAIVPGKTRAILPVHLFGQPADMTAPESHRRQARIEDHRGCGASPWRGLGNWAGRFARRRRRFQLSVVKESRLRAKAAH